MTRRIPPRGESIPPTITPHRAIQLLRDQITELGKISELQFDNPAVDAWASTTDAIVDNAFGRPNGEPHKKTLEFRSSAPAGQMYEHETRDEVQRHYLTAQQNRKALLEAFVKQLELLAPPAATGATGQYGFHAEIERVSGDLYRDGHYKQAALEAYIRVIDEVRARSGLDLDGDRLMNSVFGCDNQAPVIQFNDLRANADRDEQRGFMYLFKGIVGLRNLKAHTNRLFNDPYRAHDYLALASLLMRVLEIAAVNRP
jgi:uncharacterized protein (TIGR02391 family)